jgi:hypothetical protein
MAAVLALTLAALLIPGVARASDNPGPDTATVRDLDAIYPEDGWDLLTNPQPPFVERRTVTRCATRCGSDRAHAADRGAR